MERPSKNEEAVKQGLPGGPGDRLPVQYIGPLVCPAAGSMPFEGEGRDGRHSYAHFHEPTNLPAVLVCGLAGLSQVPLLLKLPASGLDLRLGKMGFHVMDAIDQFLLTNLGPGEVNDG